LDIYITEIETGARLALSMLPESAKYQGGTQLQVYDIINVGEAKVPKGVKLLTFSWSGRLPGESRRNASFVKSQHWKDPNEILSLWDKWRKNGTKLRLMVTETPINYDVYLDSYSAVASGGNGDYEYDISFVETKPVLVYTVDEIAAKSSAITNTNNTNSRPPTAAAAAKTYTVKSGDTLWAIAQKYLGAGNRYMDIYNANKDKVKNPNLIYPGQVLTLPS